MPVTNEGLVRDSLLKMVHNPGGDCYWVGGRPKGNQWLTSWWFFTNPSEKYARQFGSFPQFSGENKTYLKPPPS